MKVFFSLRTSTIPSNYFLASIVPYEKSAVNLIRILLEVRGHFSLSASKIFSLWLDVSIFTAMCLGVDIFALILLGFFYSWIWGNDLHCFFEVFPSLPLCPLPWTPNSLMLVHFTVPYIPLKQRSSVSILGLSVRQFACLSTGIYGRVYGLFLVTAQINCWSTLVNTSFQLLHCWFQNFRGLFLELLPLWYYSLFDEIRPSHFLLVLAWFPLIFWALFIIAATNLCLLSVRNTVISQIFKFPPLLMFIFYQVVITRGQQSMVLGLHFISHSSGDNP